MNWDRIQGNWNAFKGKMRQKYADLTDDEIEEAKGSEDKLLGLIQKKYGETREDAKKAIDNLSIS